MKKNANKNLKNTSSTIGEFFIKQFVAEKIKDTKVTKTCVFNFSDGSIQVYVCMEMNMSKAIFKKELGNELDREGFIEQKYDRECFMNKMDKELEECEVNKK